MVPSVHSRRLLAVTLLLTLGVLSACSNGDSTTGPPGPGPGAKELNSGTLGNGGVYSHTFATAGTYPYHCEIHGGMTGTVQVGTGSPASAAVSIMNNAFSPQSVSVQPGGTVTWTNNDGVAHTVTSD